MIETCMGNAYSNCCNPARYIRHTQFAGSHPLCETHAREDKDFLVDDSYKVWEEIPPQLTPEEDDPWVLFHE